MPKRKCCGNSVVADFARDVCIVCGKSWFAFPIRPPTPEEIEETNFGWVREDFWQGKQPKFKQRINQVRDNTKVDLNDYCE